MYRTHHTFPDQLAVSEGAPSMWADVVDGAEGPIEVGDRNRHPGHQEFCDFARAQLRHGAHIDKSIIGPNRGFSSLLGRRRVLCAQSLTDARPRA